MGGGALCRKVPQNSKPTTAGRPCSHPTFRSSRHVTVIFAPSRRLWAPRLLAVAPIWSPYHAGKACRTAYRRTGFVKAVERPGTLAIQFLPPGLNLDLALAAITAVPVHFAYRMVGERRPSTHAMMFGEIERVFVNGALTPQTPLEWCPGPGLDQDLPANAGAPLDPPFSHLTAKLRGMMLINFRLSPFRRPARVQSR